MVLHNLTIKQLGTVNAEKPHHKLTVRSHHLSLLLHLEAAETNDPSLSGV